MASPRVLSCRWDWCRSSFPSIDALDAHVKHEHVWPMKPMRKADIALMRRIDRQSLHSSFNTDSSSISRGPIASVTPPLAAASCPEDEEFDTFARLSSPPQAHSPKRLPPSPAFEGLIKQNGHSRLSTAVEMIERTLGHQAHQHPSHQRSPTCLPLSHSSGSSQEVVEQQLTQEDDVNSQSLLPSEPPLENEPADTELRWPTDDELDVLAAEGTRDTEQLVSGQDCHTPDPSRGQHFRCGSLDVPLGVNMHPSDTSISSQVPHAHDSQGFHSPSQSFVLQTQAPYSSQASGWSLLQ